MWALRITMPGASSDEIIRALQAAIEVFDKVGVTPIQARDGMERFEAWDDRGMKENDRRLRKKDSWRAGLWLKASEAAQATLIESHPDSEVFKKFEMDLIDMSNRTPDRRTALDALRHIARSGSDFDRESIKVAALAEQVVEDLADHFAARDLMADVTIAYTSVALAKFDRGRPVEPLREAMLAAIDRLETATAPAKHDAHAA